MYWLFIIFLASERDCILLVILEEGVQDFEKRHLTYAKPNNFYQSWDKYQGCNSDLGRWVFCFKNSQKVGI